jgi:acyl carrier protein
MDKLEQYLVDYICEHSLIETDKIDVNIDIFENGYIDSIGIYSLLIQIDDKFDKEISIEEIMTLDFYSIKNIAKLIQQ